VAVPDWGGTISFNAQIQPDMQGPALSAGTPATVNLAQGQVQRLTFSANVGDTVALSLAGVSTTPGGQNVSVNIYRPDTGVITTGNAYTSFSASGSNILNLRNLPASGTYTAVVYTGYGEPGSAQLTLVPGATGTLPSDGSVHSYAANASGQNVYLNFNANLGDNLELTLSDLNVPGASNNGLEFYVYGPSGNQVSDNVCWANGAGASCRIALWNLAAGTYSVVAVPDWGGTISFNAQIQPDALGPAISMNAPASVSLAQGQVQRLTFNANVGDTVALSLANVSTTPSGQSVYVNLYRPDTGAITTGNSFTSFSTAGSTLINLQNLPASGAYTAVVYTAYGEPGNAQLTVVPGATGSLSSGSSAQSYTANTAGQNVYLNFNANWGDNLELTLNGVNVSGASNNGFELYVYGPTGNQISDNYCWASNPGSACRIALWNLAAGTYSVVAVPDWGGIMSFNALIQPDTQGAALSVNAPASVELGLGQVERFTFNGNIGQTVVLNLTGVSSTSPAGQTVNVNVYRPDTGAITTGNYYTNFGASSSNEVTLSNLPATGIYTAVVYTNYGTPATAQLSIPPH
jgi:hypothetical protein